MTMGPLRLGPLGLVQGQFPFDLFCSSDPETFGSYLQVQSAYLALWASASVCLSMLQAIILVRYKLFSCVWWSVQLSFPISISSWWGTGLRWVGLWQGSWDVSPSFMSELHRHSVLWPPTVQDEGYSRWPYFFLGIPAMHQFLLPNNSVAREGDIANYWYWSDRPLPIDASSFCFFP